MTISALPKSAKPYYEKEQFTIVCAWCNKVQRGREWRVEPGHRNGPTTSHGICPDCFRQQIEQLGRRK